MQKIVYLPLDERPCNYLYPQMLADITDLGLIVPEINLLGKKKQPADFEKLKVWLINNTKNAKYLIVSIDMLLYGGIVPSRLHHLSMGECKERMAILNQIKKANPQIKIYGFNLIMRTPSYNNNDEEPDYYGEYGERIFKFGSLSDKREKGFLDPKEELILEKIRTEIPDSILNDFLQRREKNHQINVVSIDLVDHGIIDHLIIPLDDNSHYGFTSREQQVLTLKTEELNLVDQVLIYPGADEVGCTLFANVFTKVKNYMPAVFVRYSSTNGPFTIPRLEDRTLNESIKSQLTAVNAFMADSSHGADYVLMVNSAAISGENMADGKHDRKHHTYYSEVNHREFIQAISYYVRKEKMVALADVAVINGGDHQLLKLMSKQGLLQRIDAYAGWNTSGNTMGTVIAHAVIHSYYRSHPSEMKTFSKRSRNFYLYRLIEDWGYQSLVRQYVTDHKLPALEAHYFDIKDVKTEVKSIIKDELDDFIETFLDEGKEMEIDNIELPWNRMFEVGFDLTEKKRSHPQL